MAIESAPPYAADDDLVWWVPAEHRLAIPGRPAALALRLGDLRPRPGFPSPPAPDAFGAPVDRDPSPGGLAKQELAGCCVGGRLLVLQLALHWVGKSGFH